MQNRRITPLLLLAILSAATCRGQTVLYDFYADWCGPCRQMSATIDQLARDGYTVERIDVDRQPAAARQFAVTSLPCFVVVERGKEIDRIVGRTSIERLKLKLRGQGSGARDRRPENRTPSAINDRQSAVSNPQSPPERRPHPAWRYEKPVGHRAAVVRIYCQTDARTRSIGSGTLVRWGAKKIVVLTARHVVADSKKIVVELFNKKTYKARVLKIDAVWDCAVLELDGPGGQLSAVGSERLEANSWKPKADSWKLTPGGRQTEALPLAEVELGEEAMQQAGNRLESCGYGPDGRLAANTGLFLGYRRSTETPDGPDDWFEISGHARPGDSGGGVFNQRGRLVGVLWGTNGEIVIAVQAGRLHLLLDSALRTPEARNAKAQKFELRASDFGFPSSFGFRISDFGLPPSHYALTQYVERNPTPPKPQPIESLPACDGNGDSCPPPGPIFDEPASGTAARERDGAVLPWRGKAEHRDEELDARTRGLLEALEAERRARLAAERPQPSPPAASEPAKPENQENAASPIVAGLVIAAALAVGGVFYRISRRRTS